MANKERKAKLTDRVVSASKAEPQRYVVWDTEKKGFGLRVEPSGHKSFIVRYRTNGGGRNAPRRQMKVDGASGFSSKLRMQTMTVLTDGSNDCVPDKMITIGDLNALRGKWHRFEVHIRWSSDDEGLVEVFLDGTRVASHRGRTLTAGRSKGNYFKYGVYLCCTKGSELVTPATALYTGVVRSDTREGLK